VLREKKTYIKLSKYVGKICGKKHTRVPAGAATNVRKKSKSHALEIEDYPLVISYSLLLKMTIVD